MYITVIVAWTTCHLRCVIVTPIRNDHGRFRSQHANNYIGLARPELPPHVKEGRNEAVGRPNQCNIPRRYPRSQPGARRRDDDRPNPVYIRHYGASVSESEWWAVRSHPAPPE